MLPVCITYNAGTAWGRSMGPWNTDVCLEDAMLGSLGGQENATRMHHCVARKKTKAFEQEGLPSAPSPPGSIQEVMNFWYSYKFEVVK